MCRDCSGKSDLSQRHRRVWICTLGTPEGSLWVVLGLKHQREKTINPGDSDDKGNPSILGPSVDFGIFPTIHQPCGGASSSSPLELVGSLLDPEGTGVVPAGISFLRLHPTPCRAPLSPLEEPGTGFSSSLRNVPPSRALVVTVKTQPKPKSLPGQTP